MYLTLIVTVPSKDSVARRVPSGKKQMQTELTHLMWPLNGGRRDCPVATSYTRAVLSQDPERIRFPSNEKYTEAAHRSCPVTSPQTI